MNVHFYDEYKIETETGNGGSLFRVSIGRNGIILAIVDITLGDDQVDAVLYDDGITGSGSTTVPLVSSSAGAARYAENSHTEDVAEPDGHATRHQPRLV